MLKSIFSCLLLPLILIACASQDTPWQSEKSAAEASIWNQPVPTDGMMQDCFDAREINNFDTLNRVNLIAYGSGNSRAWLLTIAPPSPELRSNVAIQFEVAGKVCGRAGERLILGRSANRNYAIIDVRRLEADQLTRLLEEYKPTPKRSEPSPEGEVMHNDGIQQSI